MSAPGAPIALMRRAGAPEGSWGQDRVARRCLVIPWIPESRGRGGDPRVDAGGGMWSLKPRRGDGAQTDGFVAQQLLTVRDCFSRFVWARLYTSKIPVTAVQILNNHALPFFERHRDEGPDDPERQR